MKLVVPVCWHWAVGDHRLGSRDKGFFRVIKKRPIHRRHQVRALTQRMCLGLICLAVAPSSLSCTIVAGLPYLPVQEDMGFRVLEHLFMQSTAPEETSTHHVLIDIEGQCMCVCSLAVHQMEHFQGTQSDFAEFVASTLGVRWKL